MFLLALSTMTANAQRKRPQSKPPARISGPVVMHTAADAGTVLLPNRSPLITFRILFMTGAADDPAGKEGLAALTASLVAGGGRARSPTRRFRKPSIRWQPLSARKLIKR